MFSTILTSILLGNIITITPEEVREYKINKAIETLIACESEGDVMAWNNNDGAEGEHSMGILQMKMKTILWASKRYKIPMRDPLEPSFQKELTRAMIIDGRASTTQGWKNCWRKEKLDNYL